MYQENYCMNHLLLKYLNRIICIVIRNTFIQQIRRGVSNHSLSVPTRDNNTTIKATTCDVTILTIFLD